MSKKLKQACFTLLLAIITAGMFSTSYADARPEAQEIAAEKPTAKATDTHQLTASPAIKATTPPQDMKIMPFKASYTLKKGGIPVAKVERELIKKTDGKYVFESLSKPIGVATFFVKDIIVERSHWQQVEGHFRPEQYSYERTGGKRDRHVKLLFDWKKNKVTNIINNDAWKMGVPDNVQDKLLYQLSIMYDLSKEDKQLYYEVADGGRIKSYAFEVHATETIPTQVGLIETIRITRQVDNKITTIWCATKYNYLPVRIQQRDDDGEFELYIDTIAGY